MVRQVLGQDLATDLSIVTVVQQEITQDLLVIQLKLKRMVHLAQVATTLTRPHTPSQSEQQDKSFLSSTVLTLITMCLRQTNQSRTTVLYQ